jgi:perosamine synthetase
MNAPLEIEAFAQGVIAAIQSVAGNEPVALHAPEFEGNEWEYVKDCIDSNFVSSVGKYVDKFERNLEEYTGIRHAIAVSNGTSALHISLILAGVEQGDEVLVPALTFVATANAVIYCGAEPHFVDSETNSLGIDPEKLRTYLKSTTSNINGHCTNRNSGKIIRAMVPMHTFGHPSKINELLEVCKEFKIHMVEDAAESLGSFYSNKHTGTFGLLGTLSFNGNKTITTGGGGAVLTNNSELAIRAKHLTTTAKLPHRWQFVHDEVGYNYRLPNLNAALGCAQLENIEKKIERKRNLFHLYRNAFSKLNGFSLVQEPDNCRSNYWLQTLLLEPGKEHMRDPLLDMAFGMGLQLRPAWNLICQLPPYQNCQRMDLEAAELLAKQIINIPSSSGIVTHAKI